MKSVTEFAVFTLQKGLAAHNELTTQGKSPEEVSAGLGEAFKLEGDKLKHFINSIEVSKQATAGRLKRILVVTFAENEQVPSAAIKVEESYYLPEFHREAQSLQPAQKDNGKGQGRGKGRGGNGGGRRNEQRGGQRKKGPEDAAQTAELKKFASSDGRSDTTTTPSN